MEMNLGSGVVDNAPKVNWSNHQMNIFTFIRNSERSSSVEAVAGSGKTTTIVEGMKHIPQGKRAVFLAFNKAIADELSMKVPPHIQAKTFHSLCRQVIMGGDNLKLWKTKNSIMLEEYLAPFGLPKDYFFNIRKEVDTVLGLLKSQVLDEDLDVSIYKDICMESGINLEEGAEDAVFAIWNMLHDESSRFWGTMDFDDMLRAPLTRDYEFPQYDIVFVDEAQDLNPVQHAILEKIVKKGGRIIAVGDSHQAIYAFRGADGNSMGNMRRQFSMDELPLSTSYRCPLSVVERAQIFNPSIRARQGAPVGYVGFMEEVMLPRMSFDMDKSHMVLCRYNAPLMKTAISLMRTGVPIYLMGRDCVTGIIATAKKIYASKHFLTSYYVEMWRVEECEGLKSGQAKAVTDICDAIQLCIEEGAKDIRGMEKLLYNTFPKEAPPHAHITLCTIHKSKGLEADHVYIVKPGALPVCREVDPLKRTKERVQEENLHYVAITRAKERLYYVGSDAQVSPDFKRNIHQRLRSLKRDEWNKDRDG